MVTRSLILSFILSATLVCAQKEPTDFGEVSLQDLQKSDYADSASAIILFDKGDVMTDQYSTSGTTYKRHMRIKILKKAAFEEWWGTMRIFVNRTGNVTPVRGFSYNLENGTIQKSEMSKNSIFKNKYNKDYDEVTFALPNVREGSVIEFSYTITYEDLYLRPWTFQHTIPTLWSEYSMYWPRADFITHMRGSLKPTIHESKYEGKRQRWVMTNVPAFKPEPNMPNEEVYLSNVEFSYRTTTWLEIYSHFADHENFTGIVHKHNFLKEIVREVTAGLAEPRQKVKAISDYLKKEVQWNDEFDLYGAEPRKVLDKKIGSSGDINLLLGSMLEKAGLKVNMVLLSTREHGYLMEDFPSIRQFDYVICEVALPDGELLVDATEKYLPFDMLPERCHNHKGFLVGSNQYGWISIEPTKRNRISVDANLMLTGEGAVKGKLTTTKDGYAAFKARKKYFGDGEEKYKNEITSTNVGALQLTEIQNMKESEKPVVEVKEITIDDYATRSGDLIYLNPNIFLREESNPYVHTERQFPIDFEMLTDKMVVCNLTLPEGFVVEELPQSKASIITGNAAKFTFNVSQSGDRIMIVSRLQINKTLFQPSEYIGLKEFYDRLVAKKAESIVLKRKK